MCSTTFMYVTTKDVVGKLILQLFGAETCFKYGNGKRYVAYKNLTERLPSVKESTDIVLPRHIKSIEQS